MDKLSDDVILELLHYIDITELHTFCMTNSNINRICKENKSYIRRLYVKRYIPDYQDPTNFIYVVGGAEYMDWNSIFQTYTQYMSMINVILTRNVIVTSVPIFPLMTYFQADHNNLSTLPVQPSMIICRMYHNKITSFPTQPMMEHFYGEDNRLESFSVQPKMTMCYVDNNYLKDFPVQPKMIHFYGDNNQLKTFPVQPKMTHFYAANNPLVEFPQQPVLVSFRADRDISSF